MRPIAAPSLLRRLAGRLLVNTRKAELAEALGKRQFAVGVATGTEVLAHSVRALTEADPDLVVLARLGLPQRFLLSRQTKLRAAPE